MALRTPMPASRAGRSRVAAMLERQQLQATPKSAAAVTATATSSSANSSTSEDPAARRKRSR